MFEGQTAACQTTWFVAFRLFTAAPMFQRQIRRMGVVGYFENLVSKIGMTQNISPSFKSSHSTSLGDASPTTVRSTSRKPGRLRRADKAADWSDMPQGSSASVEGRLPFALHTP